MRAYPFELAGNARKGLLRTGLHQASFSVLTDECGGVRVVTRCARAVASDALDDLTRASFSLRACRKCTQGPTAHRNTPSVFLSLDGRVRRCSCRDAPLSNKKSSRAECMLAPGVTGSVILAHRFCMPLPTSPISHFFPPFLLLLFSPLGYWLPALFSGFL